MMGGILPQYETSLQALTRLSLLVFSKSAVCFRTDSEMCSICSVCELGAGVSVK